jgi:hypothetical protein
MNAELKKALEVIKKHCDTPKGKSFDEYMETASLKQRIECIKGKFLHYVDHQTIWYAHNERIKQNPGDPFADHPGYTKVELSKKQREDSIQALKWLERDVKACINHLEK